MIRRERYSPRYMPATTKRPRRIGGGCRTLVGPLVCLFSWLFAHFVAGDELELLEGEKHVGPVAQIRADGAVLGANIPAPLTLDGVRRYVRTVKKPSASDRSAVKFSVTVDLVGGGRVAGRAVTLADERLAVETLEDAVWSLPIDLVRGVRYGVDKPSVTYSQALERPPVDVDRFLIHGEEPGAIESLDALIDSLTSAAVKLELKGAERELPVARLYGFVLARPAGAKEPPPRGWLALTNESRVPFDRLELDAGVVRLTGPAELKLEIPWEAVASFDVRSERVEYLSDRKPAKVEEKSLVAPARAWRADASVAGRPMMLGERTYEKGIGVQARSRLTYALDGRFEKFLAEVGVDGETEGEGDCLVEVLADDGRSLWSGRVRGDEPARSLKLDVRGVRTLTLAVEPGEDLDLSDHVDWADARLLRAKK